MTTTKRVLVTGAAGGIGTATCRLLKQAGHTVIGADLDVERVDGALVDEAVQLDITDGTSVERVAAGAGELDSLVNLVGAGLWSATEITPMPVVRRSFDVNLFGPLTMMQAVLPGMRRRGHGTIVNLSSSAAAAVTPTVGVYTAAKVALECVSQAIAFEAAAAGVRIVVVQPGPVDTGFVERRTILDASADEYYAGVVGRVVPRLLASFDRAKQPASDVAHAIVAALDAHGPFRIPVPYDGVPGAAERQVGDERHAAAMGELLAT